MSLVLALCGLKGGIGKSVSAIYLSRALSLRGRSVAALDLDPDQQTLSDFAPALPGVAVVAADVSNLETVLGAHVGADFTFLDCGFGLNDSLREALRHTDLVLVPCVPETLEIDSTRRFLELLEKEAQLSDFTFDVRLFLSKTKKGRYLDGFQAASRALSRGLMLETAIPSHRDFERANARKTTLFDSHPDSPGALAYDALAQELENYVSQQS